MQKYFHRPIFFFLVFDHDYIVSIDNIGIAASNIATEDVTN